MPKSDKLLHNAAACGRIAAETDSRLRNLNSLSVLCACCSFFLLAGRSPRWASFAVVCVTRTPFCFQIGVGGATREIRVFDENWHLEWSGVVACVVVVVG